MTLAAMRLDDESAPARAIAADRIVHHRLHDLIGELEAAIREETHDEVKSDLVRSRDLLLQSWHIRETGEQIWVTCLSPGGTVSKLFQRHEVETRARAWIEAQLDSVP
jgi:hypothetical protein